MNVRLASTARPPALASVALLVHLACCRPAGNSLHEAGPAVMSAPAATTPAATNPLDAAAAPATSQVAYPVDTKPPKDFHSAELLRTLDREAAAAVVCRLEGLVDIFAGSTEPDVFYAASCNVFEVLKGTPGLGPLRFVWQVERGSRMPPPASELLVYMKVRREKLKEDPDLKWVAVDTGVLRYTDGLKLDVHKKHDTGR